MKKTIARLVTALIVLGASSMVHAYDYSFDFQSGKIMLDVTSYCQSLSIVTLDDLVLDVDFDLPFQAGSMAYTASVNMNLGILGLIPYNLAMNDIDLGIFQSINPYDFLGNGAVSLNHTGSGLISGQFGGYALANAILEYNITVTPDQIIMDRYAVNISRLFLSGGNTSDLLSGMINDLNQTGQIPIALSAPFTIPLTVSGTLDLNVEPVPVPAALWLFGSGLAGLVGFKRRSIQK